METPKVQSSIKDPEAGVTYHVMAYRPLTRPELVAAVRVYLSSMKRKKPKRGTTVTIVTIIGANE